MTCREFVELVTDYVEGTLPEDERRRFDHHMEGCHWCGLYFEQMKVTLRTVGRIDEASLSPDARDALLHAFREWKSGQRAT
jgi:hypothetical protein